MRADKAPLRSWRNKAIEGYNKIYYIAFVTMSGLVESSDQDTVILSTKLRCVKILLSGLRDEKTARPQFAEFARRLMNLIW